MQSTTKSLSLSANGLRFAEQSVEAKKKQGKPVRDVSRENEVFVRIKEKAAKLGLSSGQVEAVYREIVNMCSAVQE